MRGCFTVEDVAEACSHSKQVFAFPVAGATAFGVGGGVALRVAGCAEQSH